MDQTLFWIKVAAIGQVAGAIATFAAVCVSLWLARTERRPRIKVQAGLRLLIAGDGSPFEDTISIHIANHGLRSVHIASLGWRTGWMRRSPKWWAFQHAIQTSIAPMAGQAPPFDLGPGKEVSVQLSTEPFKKDGEIRDTFFNRKLPWRASPSPTKICVVVYISASKSVVARVEPALEAFLATGMIATGAAAANKKANAPSK